MQNELLSLTRGAFPHHAFLAYSLSLAPRLNVSKTVCVLSPLSDTVLCVSGGKGDGPADASKVKAFGPGLEKGKVMPGKDLLWLRVETKMNFVSFSKLRNIVYFGEISLIRPVSKSLEKST